MKDCALVVVDMLGDFIDGSMACLNAENAVKEAAAFLERLAAAEPGEEEEITGTVPVLFICDHHPADHCSFRENGGLWPAHCVTGTPGSEIHPSLLPFVSDGLVFFKGCDKDMEQYSGWEGVNDAGQSVAEVLDLLDINKVHVCGIDLDINKVHVCGIATEYCVKATAEDMLAAGKEVTLIGKALGYVDRDGHVRALEEMRRKGIRII